MAIAVKEFIRDRVREFDPQVEVRDGTPLGDIFVSSHEFIIQPFVDQLAATQVNQSLRRILAQEDPNAYDESVVDDFAANLFVTRQAGSRSRVRAKVLYNEPLDREFAVGTAQIISQSGLNFFNDEPFTITAAEMSLNRQDGLYFFEINVTAEEEGSDYNLVAGDLTTIVGDADFVQVINDNPSFISGTDRETNVDLINRTRNSIGVRDLNVNKGINAILFENFPLLQEIRSVGFQDPEMQRDILFNAHAGGYTDIYLSTPTLLTTSDEFIGLVFDTTRELEAQTSIPVPAESFEDPRSSLGNPFIVFGSVVVKESGLETPALLESEALPTTGIPFPDANQYIKVTIDDRVPVDIKVSGSVPGATTVAEVVSAINNTLGFTVASAFGDSKFRIKSLQTGDLGRVRIEAPDAPRADATSILFGSVPPIEVFGFQPIEPLEGIDFEVDYTNGRIRKLASSGPTSIITDEVVFGPLTNGVVTVGSRVFTIPAGGIEASRVSIGDTLGVNGGTDAPLGSYFITDILADDQIVLDASFDVVTSTGDIEFAIVSNQVYEISYKHNPLSIDIGNLVAFDDLGRSRGIRPGRENFTITNMAFIDTITIEEIDPDTREGLGIFVKNQLGEGLEGYGAGGFGQGPFGIGNGAQAYLKVNSPHERFSAFEDSLLVFDPVLFGKSYRITYYYAPEITAIHDFVRSDSERVTDANILAKHFIPAFVDLDITYQIDPTNVNTPTNEEIEANLRNFINQLPSQSRLESSDIVQFLQEGRFIDLPFLITADVVKPDGSIEVLEDENFIVYPDRDIPSETSDPTSKRIVRYIPRNINLTRTTL